MAAAFGPWYPDWEALEVRVGLLLGLGQSVSTRSSGKQEVTGGYYSGEAQAATALHSILAGLSAQILDHMKAWPSAPALPVVSCHQ